MRSTRSATTRRSIALPLEVVGDRWSLVLIHDMIRGISRFEALRVNNGIPTSTLAHRLKAFETHGLVERVRYEDRPPRDEYRLTEKGRDLWGVIGALSDWGDRWDLAAADLHSPGLADGDGRGRSPVATPDQQKGSVLANAATAPSETTEAPGESIEAGAPVSRGVEFYFDFRCPYSYLAHTQLRTLPGPVHLVPISSPVLMELIEGPGTTIESPARRLYAGKDLERWAARYGVELVHPSKVRLDGGLLLRIAIAAQDAATRAAVTDAIFQAAWGGHGDASPKGLEAVLSARGLPASELIAAARMWPTGAALFAATEAAAHRGVFDAPTIFVGEEMFFGHDRLDFVRERLSPTGAARGAGPA